MKRLTKWIVLLLTLVLLGTTPIGVMAQVSPPDLDQIIDDLADLEPYVTNVIVNGVKQQEFKSEDAAKDGFSQEVIQIADDMVAYQNDLSNAAAIQGISDVSKLSLSMDEYPYLQEFLELETQRLKERSVMDLFEVAAAKDVNPCGDWDHPVPDYTPAWWSSSSATPEQTLLNLGFHRTASYACEEGCRDRFGVWVDFTRGRSYTGPYGTCSSPRFRDHGRIQSSSSYAIQYGEPNPEIFTYFWPYWNWGVYCQFWHNTYC